MSNMTAPTFDSVPPQSSMTSRILIGIGGLVLLVLGTILTLGASLVGAAAVGVAWFVMRWRKRRLTRFGAWAVSVAVTAVPLLVVFIISVISVQPTTPEERQARRAEAARSRESMPEWLKNLSPAQQQARPKADSIADKLLENRGFMVWAGTMAALIGSSMIALFTGTVGWGAAMLLFRAIRGEWMGSAIPPPDAPAAA
jgi:hypothetical protein